MLSDRYVVVHGDNLWRVAVKPVSVRPSVSSSSRSGSSPASEVKLEHQTPVEIELQRAPVRFTRRVLK